MENLGDRLLRDPSTRFSLKSWIERTRQMDCVDALRDASALLEVVRQDYARATAGREAA